MSRHQLRIEGFPVAPKQSRGRYQKFTPEITLAALAADPWLRRDDLGERIGTSGRHADRVRTHLFLQGWIERSGHLTAAGERHLRGCAVELGLGHFEQGGSFLWGVPKNHLVQNVQLSEAVEGSLGRLRDALREMRSLGVWSKSLTEIKRSSGVRTPGVLLVIARQAKTRRDLKSPAGWAYQEIFRRLRDPQDLSRKAGQAQWLRRHNVPEQLVFCFYSLIKGESDLDMTWHAAGVLRKTVVRSRIRGWRVGIEQVQDALDYARKRAA